MPESTKIRVMISSRCETEIEFKGKRQKLSKVRRALKKQLEDFRLPNQEDALFDYTARFVSQRGSNSCFIAIGRA